MKYLLLASVVLLAMIPIIALLLWIIIPNVTLRLTKDRTLMISGRGNIGRDGKWPRWPRKKISPEQVVVDKDIPNYTSDRFGVLFNKEKTELVQVPRAIGKYVIPSGVTRIGSGAFYDCRSLTSITIPNGVTSIGSDAFHGCSSLTSITIPDSVKSIGSCAFFACSSLTNIKIPNGVTVIDSEYIGDRCYGSHMGTFQLCSSLTSITIPNTVTRIEPFSFSNCEKLRNVYYTGSESEWERIEIGIVNDELKAATIHFNSHA